jgi:hypothetical protein
MTAIKLCKQASIRRIPADLPLRALSIPKQWDTAAEIASFAGRSPFRLVSAAAII